MSVVLIDAGPIIAYFDKDDELHRGAQQFISKFRGQFITTTAVITEVMWQLRSDHRVQNEFLLLLSRGLFRNEALTAPDFARIAELNQQYCDLPPDFADLSLVSIAERLNISDIVSIDREFDVYKSRQGHNSIPFRRILPEP